MHFVYFPIYFYGINNAFKTKLVSNVALRTTQHSTAHNVQCPCLLYVWLWTEDHFAPRTTHTHICYIDHIVLFMCFVHVHVCRARNNAQRKYGCEIFRQFGMHWNASHKIIPKTIKILLLWCEYAINRSKSTLRSMPSSVSQSEVFGVFAC